MKKMFTLFAALAVVISSFAATVVETPSKKASEIFVPIGKKGAKISVLDLSRISVKDFQTISGRHLKLSEKIGFKVVQRELRKSISPNGTIEKTKLLKALKAGKPASEQSRKYLRLTLIFLGLAVAFSIIGALVYAPFIWILASLSYLASAVFFVLWLVQLAQE